MTRLGRGRTVATYNRHSIPGAVRFDSLTMTIDEIPGIGEVFHAVILLGETRIDACRSNIVQSRALNVDSIRRIIDSLLDRNIHIIFVSSDNVFDGRCGGYVESDPQSPICVYGAQKVEVERYLVGTGAPHAIVRLAKVYGSTMGDGTLLSNWIADLDAGRDIIAARDQRFSPIHIDDVLAGIHGAIDLDLGGIFHLGGPESMSRLQLAEKLIRAYTACFGSVRTRLIPCNINDLGLLDLRPLNLGLISNKIVEAVRFTPTQIDCAIDALIRLHQRRQVF
jgi:dTDP-4-dehydrorhamnose reductase